MDAVSYELVDDVATVTMDDGKANALTFEMFAALDDALGRAEADGAAVVLTGREGRFSGGFDLRVLGTASPETPDLLRTGFRFAHRMLSHPRPVVVAASGHTYAMALFLTLTADWRVGVAGADHRFTANETAIGMVMPRTAVAICRDRLPTEYFERVVVQAEVFSPEGALGAGVLHELVAPEDLHATATAAARRLADLNAAAFAGTRTRVRAALLEELSAAIDADDAELRALL